MKILNRILIYLGEPEDFININMRVIVCGGRDFEDVEFVIHYLNHVHNWNPITCVIAGAARGVDTFAELWADEMGIPKEVYPADWDKHGKSAGPIRNQEMLDKSNPDMIMAFPGGRGTAHMFKIAEAHGGVDLWQSKQILFRKRDPKYGFMSNFAEGFEFVDQDGLIWSTSEHHYQAQKATNEEDRSRVQMARTAFDSKQIGGSITLRPDWDEVKIDCMRQTLALKFAEGSKAADRLMDTQAAYLVEDTPWGDQFWGKTYGVGESHLGKLLMERRESLILGTPVRIWYPE